jgi:hypothetical protein
MIGELIEHGMEAENRKRQEFFDLAGRFRAATDPAEVRRLDDKMGRNVFVGRCLELRSGPAYQRACRGIAGLNRLRCCVKSKTEVPENDWCKDLGPFNVCGRSSFLKTFRSAARRRRERGSDQTGRVKPVRLAAPA